VPATVQVVDDPRHAALLAAPVRRRILAALAEPGSATSVAKSLRLPRQLVAYHVRQLETGGYLKLVREEQRRGCVERIVQRTARYLVAAPDVLSAQGIDPRAFKDKFSSGYLIALATRMAREVADAQAAAERAGRPLATLSAEVEVRLRSPAERQAFAGELLEAVTRLVEKYHHADFPDGRTYRLVVGAHPIRTPRRKE
jgi:DNA-binding transcriptional ArsR family regulator